jgi:hypothetical protein
MTASSEPASVQHVEDLFGQPARVFYLRGPGNTPGDPSEATFMRGFWSDGTSWTVALTSQAEAKAPSTEPDPAMQPEPVVAQDAAADGRGIIAAARREWVARTLQGRPLLSETWP